MDIKELTFSRESSLLLSALLFTSSAHSDSDDVKRESLQTIMIRDLIHKNMGVSVCLSINKLAVY